MSVKSRRYIGVAMMLALSAMICGCNNKMKMPKIGMPRLKMPDVKAMAQKVPKPKLPSLPTIDKPEAFKDKSPELQSIAESKQQRKWRHRRTRDTNMRQIWNDLDAIMLLDYPSHMSEYPIP